MNALRRALAAFVAAHVRAFERLTHRTLAFVWLAVAYLAVWGVSVTEYDRPQWAQVGVLFIGLACSVMAALNLWESGR